MKNLPNILTISRIAVIPVVFATIYIEGPLARWVACGVFLLAALTDFFDGYLARNLETTSRFGRFLDPIADKLLVAAVLFMLAASERLSPIGVLPAVIILCREVLVSGLREYLAEIRVNMPVTRLAKWKTAFQMTALPVLIVGDAAPGIFHFPIIGEFFLWLAAILTLLTGYDYLKTGLAHMDAPPPEEKTESSGES